MKPCHEKRDSERKNPSILQVPKPFYFQVYTFGWIASSDFLELNRLICHEPAWLGNRSKCGSERYSMMMLGVFVPIKNTGCEHDSMFLRATTFSNMNIFRVTTILAIVAPHKTKADQKWGEKGKSSTHNVHRKRRTFRWDGGVPTPF